MTDITVTVKPAPVAPVVPEPPPIDPIRIVVHPGVYAPHFTQVLLPGKHTDPLAGKGVTWRPHKHSREGTLGFLVIHNDEALRDADGDVVVLDRIEASAGQIVGGWDSFDPNGDPEADESGDERTFRYCFADREWTREDTPAGRVWTAKTHDRESQRTAWARLTIAHGCDVALFERTTWEHPDSDLWRQSQGRLDGRSEALDRKLRVIKNAAATRAMVEKWTGPTWLGSPTPTAMLEHDEALRFIEAHDFRAQPNSAGAYVRCGNGVTAAHVAWPIGGASSAIATAIARQASMDFSCRPYWLREDGNLPIAVDGKASVTFHKENPFIVGSSLASQLGWEMLTNEHLATNGADHQHEGHWLLVTSAALFGELWAEVAVRCKAAMLALDRNFEVASTQSDAKWLQNGRGRGRPQGLVVMIAMSTRENETRTRMESTCWKWNGLRARRRASLNFPREAVAQVLTRTQRGDTPFFTGYEEALDCAAVFQSLQLFNRDDPMFRMTVREAICLGRVTASSMRLINGEWKSGYQVPCNDEGTMLPTTSYAGDTLRYWTLGGLLAYEAAAAVAAVHAPDLLDPIDTAMVEVARTAAYAIGAQWASFPARHSAAETLCALGQAAGGTAASAWIEMVPVAPVGTT